jgi:peroxiredoxin Q/BCP
VGDPEGKIRKAYKVQWPLLGIARRVTYVVGPHRKVLSVHHGERDTTAHVARAREVVSQATAS